MSSAGNLKQSIKNLNMLPAMPAIAQKLLALRLDTEEGEREMLRLIAQDPQISARIVGLANTPLFGTSRKVSAIGDAAMLLGMARVRTIAFGIAVMSLLNKQTAGKLDIQGLWLHSLSVALSARAITSVLPVRNRPLDDQIFLAGLLHDIGYLVLPMLDLALSDELVTRITAEPGRPVLEIERELLGTTHCELGAELARQWDLPEEIIAVLRYHHDPDAEGAKISPYLVRTISIAEQLQPVFGIADSISANVSDIHWQALETDPAQIESILAQIDELNEQARSMAGAFS